MSKDKKFKIEYNGKSIETDFWSPISDEEYEKARHDYFDLPDTGLVFDQLKKVAAGGTRINYITHYYFRDLMAKVKIHYNPWTIEDVFNCKQLVEYFNAKTTPNTKVYPVDWSLKRKMVKAFSIAGKGVASPPTQFSLKVVDDVLNKYNVNNVWYDYSCGWGVRLLGALRNNVNYIGTDPNYALCNRLKQMYDDYKTVNKCNTTVDIRPTGSEDVMKEYIGKVGLAFSSPPYFDIEDYRIGNQSYREGTTYDDWLDNYVRPTIKNIYEYLIDGGYFCVNINNTKQHDLLADWKAIAEQIGLHFVCYEDMKNKHRVYGVQGDTSGEVKEYNNDELIAVFRK